VTTTIIARKKAEAKISVPKETNYLPVCRPEKKKKKNSQFYFVSRLVIQQYANHHYQTR
jgi:hypothetical protein